jgi:DNA-binding PadR family transcriptional regulator
VPRFRQTHPPVDVTALILTARRLQPAPPETTHFFTVAHLFVFWCPNGRHFGRHFGMNLVCVLDKAESLAYHIGKFIYANAYNMLKYALLGFLNYRPTTGYDLKRIMDDSISNFWHADLSQIYKTLKSLEAEGAIISAIEAQDDRPDRKVYTITAQGRAELSQWLATPLTETSPLKETLLLKVFFAGDLRNLVMQLSLQRELHLQKLNQYQTRSITDIEQNSAFMQISPEQILLWEATRRAGILYEEMYLRWLDETIAQIEAQLR